jgi:hypothetical protein
MPTMRRRMQDVRKRWARRRSRSLAPNRQDELIRASRPPRAPNLGWLTRRRGKPR